MLNGTSMPHKTPQEGIYCEGSGGRGGRGYGGAASRTLENILENINKLN